MIYFFYGEDSYSILKKVSETRADFLASEGDMNLTDLDGEKITVDKFSTAVLSMPFLGTKRLSFVKNLLSDNNDKEVKKKIIDLAKSIPEYSTVIFFETSEFDKRESAYKDLQKTAKSKEFGKPAEFEMKKFIEKMILDAGLHISSALIFKIMMMTGPDYWRIESEVNKLILLTKFKKQKEVDPIAVEDLMIDPINSSKIFDLTDCLAERNLKKAIQMLNSFRRKSEDESMIFNMIIYQLRNMLIVEDLINIGRNVDGVVKESGLHPFVAKKVAYSVKKFQRGDLRRAYALLGELDWKIKSGVVDVGTALDLAMVNFCEK